MFLTATTIYAIDALLCLAKNQGQYINSKVLSEKVGTSQNYLQRVMQVLIKADLVVQKRGIYGGYRLHRSPEEISLYDIIVETETASKFEFTEENSSPLETVIYLSEQIIKNYFSAIYIKDLAEDEDTLQAHLRDLVDKLALKKID